MLCLFKSLYPFVKTVERDFQFLYVLQAAVQYILISGPGQPFLSQFVLYRIDIGLIKQTINRTSRCNKVDAVRLYASYRLNLLLLKRKRCMVQGVLIDIERYEKKCRQILYWKFGTEFQPQILIFKALYLFNLMLLPLIFQNIII